jgi:hypothetical protein
MRQEFDRESQKMGAMHGTPLDRGHSPIMQCIVELVQAEVLAESSGATSGPGRGDNGG